MKKIIITGLSLSLFIIPYSTFANKVSTTTTTTVKQFDGFQIFIHEVLGTKKITLYVDPSNTIANIKSQITFKTGIQESKMRLLWAGKELEDNRTLSDYGIPKEAVIALVVKNQNNNYYLVIFTWNRLVLEMFERQFFFYFLN